MPGQEGTAGEGGPGQVALGSASGRWVLAATVGGTSSPMTVS